MHKMSSSFRGVLLGQGDFAGACSLQQFLAQVTWSLAILKMVLGSATAASTSPGNSLEIWTESSQTKGPDSGFVQRSSGESYAQWELTQLC